MKRRRTRRGAFCWRHNPAQKAEALRVNAADDRLEGRIAELLLQLPDEEQE